MLGVVLCGGQSRRMQFDKGLLTVENEAQFIKSARLLSKVVPEVVISVRPEQTLLYKNAFDVPGVENNNFPLIADSESITIGGPLKGILSVHEKNPKKDLLVLAVDYLSMQTDPLVKLLKLHAEKQNKGDTNYDALCWTINGHFEPLCTIYMAPFLSNMYSKITLENETLDSPRRWLEKSRILVEEVPPEFITMFKNYNFPQDLKNG